MSIRKHTKTQADYESGVGSLLKGTWVVVLAHQKHLCMVRPLKGLNQEPFALQPGPIQSELLPLKGVIMDLQTKIQIIQPLSNYK